MAKSTREPPRMFEAVAVNDAQMPDTIEDLDSEAAWEGWISDLRAANGSGLIRVSKLPTDADGAPLPNAKGQVQLMSCPHDQYDYDSLLAHIRMRFMKPGEIMHVRIVGVEPGKQGVKVNNIVSLQRDAALTHEVEGVTGQLGEVLTAMREDRAAMTTLLQGVLTPKEPPPPPPPSAFGPMMGEALKIGLPIVGGIITALISRPAKPPADLMGLVEIARMLKGDFPEEKDDSDSWQSLVKAIAPGGLQLLSTLAANTQRAAPAPARHPTVPVTRAPALPTMETANSASHDAPAVPVENGTRAPDAMASSESVSVQASPTPKTQEGASMLALLKPQLEELCELAARGEPVEPVAELTMQLLPEQFDEPLGALVETPESFQKLTLLVPRMKEFAPWFEALRVELKKQFTDESAP